MDPRFSVRKRSSWLPLAWARWRLRALRHCFGPKTRSAVQSPIRLPREGETEKQRPIKLPALLFAGRSPVLRGAPRHVVTTWRGFARKQGMLRPHGHFDVCKTPMWLQHGGVLHEYKACCDNMGSVHRANRPCCDHMAGAHRLLRRAATASPGRLRPGDLHWMQVGDRQPM